MKRTRSYFKPAFVVLSISLLVIVFAVISCGKKPYVAPPQPAGLKPTPTNPWLPSKAYDYAVGGNNDLVTLGRVLFYDKNLSGDNSVSCGSCHQQAYGFADNKQFSTGFGGTQTPRNAHSIMQTNNSHFWDGKNQPDFTTSVAPCTDYTCQPNGSGPMSFVNPVSIPFQSHVELNLDMNLMVQKISGLPYYKYLYPKAFNGQTFITIENIETALGTFMANITAGDSKFSRVKAGTEQFTASEQAGYNVFNSKGKCAQCHKEQNGFGGNPGQFEDVGLSASYTDLGRGSVTGFSSDNGRFHVPSLNNISLTAPYMHDGRLATLNDVVDFFDSGVHQSPNVSSALTLHPVSNGNGGFQTAGSYPVQPLNLTTTEKANLVAFLNTLSDVSVTTDIRFSDPFKH
ncbi:MAG: cytochrome-c peroxidase [Bacteroidia bacterium]